MRFPNFLVLVALVMTSAFQVSRAEPLQPEHVAVVYNANSPHGRELAIEYMRLRDIPVANLAVIACTPQETVSREEYERDIAAPLRRFAVERSWWIASQNKDAPLESRKIYAAVLISGVPLKIAPAKKDGSSPPPQQQTDAASVDSELALLAFGGLPKNGWLGNPYFNKDQDIVGSPFPVLLVTRLDSPSLATTRRMMHDAVKVEQSGLWGWAVIDAGGPYPQGNEWLEKSARLAREHGMPVLYDNWKTILPTGYPLMRDVAVYLGWYSTTVGGAIADDQFTFKPGAVAVHIHSFSASTLRNPKGGWSGPLLEKGAAVTLGNVYEPFLSGSHFLSVFFDRLLKGYTIAEASAMSIPMLSWQSTVLGDPLYRPFAMQSKGSIIKNERDKYFQAWWTAGREWGGNPLKRKDKLENAAAATGAGRLFWEALAYEAAAEGRKDHARRYFRHAREAAGSRDGRARADLENAALLKGESPGETTLRAALDELGIKFSTMSYSTAVGEWKKTLPAPPPANSNAKP